MLGDAGGLKVLATEHEELSAHHGNNYLPLLDRFHRGHRALLFRLASTLAMESTSADRMLLDALDYVLAEVNRLGPINELLRSWTAGSHWSVVALTKLAA